MGDASHIPVVASRALPDGHAGAVDVVVAHCFLTESYVPDVQDGADSHLPFMASYVVPAGHVTEYVETHCP